MPGTQAGKTGIFPGGSMIDTTSNQLVGKLATTVNSLLAGITGNEASYAHIWYEESLNFGDSAIWLGQKNSLHQLRLYPE